MKRHTILSLIITLIILDGPAFARTAVEAYVGQPFGVGKVTVDVPSGALIAPPGDDRINVVEQNGRVLYPVTPGTPVRRLVRRFLKIESPYRVTIHFLFRGDGPLDLTVYAPTAIPVHVQPIDHARKHQRTLDGWWQAYTKDYSDLSSSGEYPLVVQNYLTTTMARRLHKRPPEKASGLFKSDDANTALGLLLGAESIRAAMQKDLLLGSIKPGAVPETAALPLPKPVIPPPVVYPIIPDEVPIEPIAMHVPHECLYVRFGNFTNYLWLRDFTEQWGGDMANMISVRGINYHLDERIEQQLGLKQTALAKILGPTVIADIAIVGSDPFVREGAAIGVLFQARNNMLLGNDIRRQQNEAKARHADAIFKTLKIAGHDVTYVSTPTGSVRSYYAVDGDFHFVTTSRTLVRRFFEAGQGIGTLGRSKEFRYARFVVPIERDDTIFAYLSDMFFRQLVGPQYRVEMTRRMRSLAEIDALRIARLAARAEGVVAHSVEELISADLLPPGFGYRPDGSQLIETEGGFIDTHRGAPGTFTPIPDMPIDGVTPSEAAEYERFATMYRSNWQRVDPVVAAILRTPLGPPGLERMSIELMVTPYHKGTYGRVADMLGPPMRLAKAPVVGDLVSLDVVFGGKFVGQLKGQPPSPWHLFGALRDSRVPLEVRQGHLPTDIPTMEKIRGYLGAWPRPGFFSSLVRTPEGAPFDEHGYAPAQSLLGDDHWQRRFDDWFVFSFRRDVLEEVTPQLSVIEFERPAQVRLRIDDLTGKDLASLANSFGYSQARKASASGSRFMNSLTRQLHIHPAECKAVAEGLIGGTLQCPIGGEYQLVELPGGPPVWVSNALTQDNRFFLADVPPDYTFPLLTWFRGITAELSLTGDTLSAFVELDIQNKPNAAKTDEKSLLPGLKLPSFGFGGKKNDEEDKPGKPLSPPKLEELPPPLR